MTDFRGASLPEGRHVPVARPTALVGDQSTDIGVRGLLPREVLSAAPVSRGEA